METNENSYLTGFYEKPITNFNVSMGIYMANKKILDFIPMNQSFGFDHLMLELIKQNQKVNVKTFDGYWLDIGRPDDYERAINEFDKIFTQ